MSLADEIVAGEICACCLLPFTEINGYPAVCDDCWKTPANRKQYQRSAFKRERPV